MKQVKPTRDIALSVYLHKSVSKKDYPGAYDYVSSHEELFADIIYRTKGNFNIYHGREQDLREKLRMSPIRLEFIDEIREKRREEGWFNANGVVDSLGFARRDAAACYVRAMIKSGHIPGEYLKKGGSKGYLIRKAAFNMIKNALIKRGFKIEEEGGFEAIDPEKEERERKKAEKDRLGQLFQFQRDLAPVPAKLERNKTEEAYRTFIEEVERDRGAVYPISTLISRFGVRGSLVQELMTISGAQMHGTLEGRPSYGYPGETILKCLEQVFGFSRVNKKENPDSIRTQIA